MNVRDAEAVQIRRFSARLSEVRHVRRFVGEFMAGRSCADDAIIAVSELAANAIQHSGSDGGGDFTVRLAHREGAVLIAVTNAGGAERPTLGRNSPEDTSGRGLFIVDSISRRWGVVQGSAGTSVWCEIGCVHAPALQECVAA